MSLVDAASPAEPGVCRAESESVFVSEPATPYLARDSEKPVEKPPTAGPSLPTPVLPKDPDRPSVLVDVAWPSAVPVFDTLLKVVPTKSGFGLLESPPKKFPLEKALPYVIWPPGPKVRPPVVVFAALKKPAASVAPSVVTIESAISASPEATVSPAPSAFCSTTSTGAAHV